MRSSAIVLATLLVVGADPVALAQCEYKQLAKLVSGVQPPAAFGGRVRLDKNVAVVRLDPVSSSSVASVQVFERQSGSPWSFSTALTSPSGLANDGFGHHAIDVADNRIAVGAALYPGASFGAVYLFEKGASGWKSTATVLPSIPVQGSFGWNLCLTEDRLFVLGGDQHVEVFTRSSSQWIAEGVLIPPSLVPGAQFGNYIDAEGDVAAVVAQFEQIPGGGSGAVYVFEFDNGSWAFSKKLVPSPSLPQGIGNFGGGEVAVWGNRVLVGIDGAYHGGAFLFEKLGVTWQQVALVGATNAPPGSGYGQVIDMDGGSIVIGAPFLSVGGATYAGAAYVYREVGDGWVEQLRLTANGLDSHNLGASIAVSGDEVLVGAPNFGGDPGGSAAYLFSTIPNTPTSYGDGCAGSGGFVPRLSIDDSYDGCKHVGDTVGINVAGGLGGSSCLLFLGTTSATLQLPGGCPLLVMPSISTVTLPLSGAVPGNGTIALGATIPLGFPNVSLYMQGFIPDPGVPQGFSATNGLRLTTY